jgi:hypothetical protein
MKFENHCYDLIDYMKKIIDSKSNLIEKNIVIQLIKILEKEDIFLFPDNYPLYLASNELSYDYREKNKDFIVSYNYENYEILSDYTELKINIPTVYLFINKNSLLKKEIEIFSGSKYEGHLILLFRKVKKNWQIPVKGVSILKNKSSIFELFKLRCVAADRKELDHVIEDLNHTLMPESQMMFNMMHSIIYNENNDNINISKDKQMVFKCSIFDEEIEEMSKSKKFEYYQKTKKIKKCLDILSKYSIKLKD